MTGTRLYKEAKTFILFLKFLKDSRQIISLQGRNFMRLLWLIFLLVMSACGEAPKLPEKTYLLGSNDKQLLEIKTGGAEYSVKNLELKSKAYMKTQTVKLQPAKGFDKYVYQGDNGELLVVFPNGLIVNKGKGFNFSVGFEIGSEQRIADLDGKYNYVEALYVQTSETEYSSSFDAGTIVIENNYFTAKGLYFKPEIKGKIEAQENGTFRGVLAGSDTPFANFIVKMENGQKIVVASILYSGTKNESGLLFATSEIKLVEGNYNGKYTLLSPYLESTETIIVSGTSVIEDNKTRSIIYNSPKEGSVMAKDRSFQGLPTPSGIFFGYDFALGLFAAVKQ